MTPTSEISNELLPCPFCGSEAEYIFPAVSKYYMQTEVKCSNPECYVIMKRITAGKSIEKTINAAITKWNARHESAKTGVEEMVNAVRDEIIKEYGSMSIQIDEPNISGYFITGIVKSALQKLLEK